MKRLDITDDLVHFIRGDTLSEAFQILKKILGDRCLVAGTGFIRGQYRCVCFSEAPIAYLGYALLHPPPGVTYQPLGIMVKKPWLYALGGRPVIYQSDAEFYELPEHMRWRHVRYEPTHDPAVDFTWEREWRIHTDVLHISPETSRVVVPTREVSQALLTEHEREQDYLEQQYALILDEIIAWQLREEFPWEFVCIETLV